MVASVPFFVFPYSVCFVYVGKKNWISQKSAKWNSSSYESYKSVLQKVMNVRPYINNISES